MNETNKIIKIIESNWYQVHSTWEGDEKNSSFEWHSFMKW